MTKFADRHIGISSIDLPKILSTIGVDSLEHLIKETIPDSIRTSEDMGVGKALSEFDYLNRMKEIEQLNQVKRSFLGLGYYGTITPSVILRNVFENPGWYTQYTPYQAEIAQGRLEALLNFQTMVCDLTGFELANASLLDEGTASAEAMIMFYHQHNKKRKKNPAKTFLVHSGVMQQTLAVVEGRAEPLGYDVKIVDNVQEHLNDSVFGVLVQYPAVDGACFDFSSVTEAASKLNIFVCAACDLLSLTLLKPPAEWGADVAIGTTQRFGIPMGYGGPHAAYFACGESFKRQIPGRIIGVSIDRHENPALRMALQTREQHIKRDKATSNICTAQALLAIMAGFYAVYHGAEGLKGIATNIHNHTVKLSRLLEEYGFEIIHNEYFDTICIEVNTNEKQRLIIDQADRLGINLRASSESQIVIALDETTSPNDIDSILKSFISTDNNQQNSKSNAHQQENCLPKKLLRTSEYLTHEVFNRYQSETEMMRYVKSLENKDLSLVHSMIPLGSCTMKLNSASSLMPVSWAGFANMHPFAPESQAQGYKIMFDELSDWLCKITGFAACSLQPNSGAQGEYAGLMTIRGFHLSNGDIHRNIVLIPSSAHGTNPASAVMAGMKVVVVACDKHGNIDVDDLKLKVSEHSVNLCGLMVTYPSTHGVFETAIREICDLIHDHGGRVYLDGANMNAQVGLTNPGFIGADVCHLNLHKTFSIPHGGGGPGMGPICCTAELEPFLPGHPMSSQVNGLAKPVSAAPFGSASILLISHAYIAMLGDKGLTDSSRFAILNANYIRARLQDHFQVLYTGESGFCAHELILDLRPFKALDISAEDVAKRLIDYGFHAPTMSFPVAGTIMIEPTESESLAELDRFCDAMIQIREEIDAIATGQADATDNVLMNAPHTIEELTADEWTHSYTRQEAAWMNENVKRHKFWPSVARVNNGYGDRNLICTCPPVESYAE